MQLAGIITKGNRQEDGISASQRQQTIGFRNRLVSNKAWITIAVHPRERVVVGVVVIDRITGSAAKANVGGSNA